MLVRLFLSCALGLGAVTANGALAFSQANRNQKQTDVAESFDELTRSLEKFTQTLEKRVEESVEKYGQEIEAWAERYGQEMEKWAKENAGRWEAWAEEFSGEFEKWAEENAGKFEQMGRELEKRFSELEGRLQKESQSLSNQAKSQHLLSVAAEQIRQELEKTDPQDKEKIEKLKQKLFAVLKERKQVDERTHVVNPRNEYLERRIDQIRSTLKSDLPKEKRAVLEKSLAELTDLKAASRAREEKDIELKKLDVQKQREGRIKATHERLHQMMVAEQQRHERVMQELKQEAQRLSEHADRAKAEAQRAQAEVREAEARARQAKEREQGELNGLREEVKRLKKELEALKK
jgi:hypothetical protein